MPTPVTDTRFVSVHGDEMTQLKRHLMWGATAALLLAPAADARPAYEALIPNGSCAACHINPAGGGARNSFGPNAAGGTLDWTSVYNLDSDGDGQTNGEELGDPCGVWTPGSTPARISDISIPGDMNSTSADPNTPACPVEDAGTPAEDAGTDAGTPADDAGAPADAGTPPDDAGTPPEDAGAPDDAGVAPDPCEGLTIQGECNGTQLRYCQDDAIVEVECDTLNGQAPAGTATCGEIDAEWGFDCKLVDGEACQGDNFVAFCQDGSGCTIDLDAETATCTDVGTCTPDDNFDPVCDGDHLTLDCNRGQPYGLICPEGSTCGNGACNDIAEGGPCDGDVLLCADGLTCQAGECSRATPSPEGEPDGEPDTNEPDTTDDGCESSAVPSRSAPLLSLGLLALFGLVRRRRD